MGKQVRRAVVVENVRHLFPEEAEQFFDHGLGTGTRYIKNLKPKGAAQQALMEAIDTSGIVLALGPAGTGKTYVAVSKAVEALNAKKVSRIVLSRPAVEAGERIGFLPGDLKDKLDPYMRPLYDVLHDRLGGRRLSALMAEGVIEIAPIGYMRGRTINDAFNTRTTQNDDDPPRLGVEDGGHGRSGPVGP